MCHDATWNESDFWKLPSLHTYTLPCYQDMRLRTVLVAAIGALLPFASSQAEESQTYKYEVSSLSLRTACPPLSDLQSDISRLRSLVIHSLYSHKDVFLRELLSNANDALEKLRITALTDREVMSSGEANVTIEVKIDEDSGGKTGKIIVRG
jgi:heat shock protein beta